MDSVQIYFICLDGIYYICILLHSSKKKLQGNILLFPFEKKMIQGTIKPWHSHPHGMLLYMACCYIISIAIYTYVAEGKPNQKLTT